MQRAPTDFDNEQLMQLAREAITYTERTLSLGSINKYTDQLKETYALACQKLPEARALAGGTTAQVLFFKNYNNRRSPQDNFMTEMIVAAYTFTKARVGNCKEHAIVALSYLANKNLESIELCQLKEGGDHCFLRLNGTIICDPWANHVFHVSEFDAVAKAVEDFRYADAVYADEPHVKPYFYGKLTVLGQITHSSDFEEIVLKSEKKIASEDAIQAAKLAEIAAAEAALVAAAAAKLRAKQSITFNDFTRAYYSNYSNAGLFGRNPFSKMQLKLMTGQIRNMDDVFAYSQTQDHANTRTGVVLESLIRQKMA